MIGAIKTLIVPYLIALTFTGILFNKIFIYDQADSTLKCNRESSKKNREAGDAKFKHFLGLMFNF